jgi:hypothetical protein
VLARLQEGQSSGVDEQLDGTRRPSGASDETEAFELLNHPVNGRCGHPEERLHVALGWGPSVERGIGVVQRKGWASVRFQ